MKARETIVVKISGNFIQPENPMLIRRFAEALSTIGEMGYRPIVVVGGGRIARLYIEAGRRIGANEALLDLIGIQVTRLNARLLINALGGKALNMVPKTVVDLLRAYEDPKERIIVMGGLQPGQSTNAVSAIAAEVSGARLIINATRVDGVYTKDPEKHSDAKLIKKITVNELRYLLESQSAMAGKYELFDPPSLTIIYRSGITVRVVNGSEPYNIVRVLQGEDLGTIILPR